MKRVSATRVQADLPTYLDDSHQEPVVVTRSGRPVAVLMGVRDNDDVERLLLAWSPKLRAILDKSRQQIRDGQGIPHEEFWSAVERKHPPIVRHKKARRKTA